VSEHEEGAAQALDHLEEQEDDEGPYVSHPDAVADEGAVVVHAQDAVAALRAVVNEHLVPVFAHLNAVALLADRVEGEGLPALPPLQILLDPLLLQSEYPFQLLLLEIKVGVLVFKVRRGQIARVSHTRHIVVVPAAQGEGNLEGEHEEVLDRPVVPLSPVDDVANAQGYGGHARIQKESREVNELLEEGELPLAS